MQTKLNTKELSNTSEPHERLARNLQALIDSRGLTEAALSRYTNIPQPTLYKLTSAKTEDPRILTLQALAHFFNLSVDDLYALEPPIAKKEELFVQSIPIISWDLCDKGLNAISALNPTNWSDWLTIEREGKHLYALLSRASMEPKFPKGTAFIVDPQLTPTDGNLVVVGYSDTFEATLRELSTDGPTKRLLSISDRSKSEELTNQIKIFGTVVQSRFTY